MITLPRDRSRQRVVEDLQFLWEITEGGGSLSDARNQEIEYLAPATPGLARLKVSVTQRAITCVAEALITVSATLEAGVNSTTVTARGLPGYTFERAAGELWRSRFDVERNLIIVNNGHRDFVFARKNRAWLLFSASYVKELVLRNRWRSPRAAPRAHDRADTLCGREVEVWLARALVCEARIKF